MNYRALFNIFEKKHPEFAEKVYDFHAAGENGLILFQTDGKECVVEYDEKTEKFSQ